MTDDDTTLLHALAEINGHVDRGALRNPDDSDITVLAHAIQNVTFVIEDLAAFVVKRS
ncbi:MAG TPA: hypothetical protein VMV16_00690 [Solirubrobacteraceae bacterium]|nr:hypothetical protein [Solirubrobacteraceae bacterium]